ncbi:hypothetical protein MNBD_GAMMA21-1902 [hydrothermal vent metagenome]|uniref:DNA 3'-5' helicase n=1 Tax=hydrothermal vent metagenome TaxID=652676 RepID=A0A3B1ALF9_9ZZZZ
MSATTRNVSTSSNTADFSTVHASAGSGKTFHLVSHIVRLLIQGASPASILAITFTRKAAAEMQQRLLERIYELATCTKTELNHTLSEQLGLTASPAHRENAQCLYENLLHSSQTVRTTTFHAFCQDLLRRFPMEANLPPGFELVERTGYLIDDAWNSLTNKLTRSDNQNTSETIKKHMEVLLHKFGTDRTKTILNKFIGARSEWWALIDTQDDVHDFNLDRYLANLAQQLGTTAETSAESLILEYFSDKTCQQQLVNFLELLHKHPIKSNLECATSIEQALAMPDDNSSALKKLDSLWSAFFTSTENKPRSRKPNKTMITKMGEQGCDQFIEIHHAQCERLIELQQALHAIETLTITRAWIGAGQAYIDEYQQIKRFHRYLDFSDLEWQCYCLLNSSDHADWVQYKLDQRVEHLLIDEFQDTNPTQWQLVLPLLSEIAASEQERFRSVLLVGDAKQSIYRFRRAEPKLFSTASNWLETNLNAKKHFLNQSYRSSPAIIDFVNRFFDNNPDFELPDFQIHQTHKTKLAGSVTVLPIITPLETEPQPISATELRNPLHTPRANSLTFHYYEAQEIARTINKLIDDKTIIGSAEQSKYLRHTDIIILLRNRTHAIDYERALREAHIPYLGTERGTLLESLEIKDMVNLLQWLITPFDNHALAGVLRSPLFSARNEDLYPLAGQAHWFEYITEHLEEYTPEHPMHRAVKLLTRWIQLTDTLPVHDLLDRIYSEANVLARYTANYPEHLQARAQSNLTKFIELALENDSGRYPSLTRFLAWLKLLKQQDKEAPDQAANDAEQNRVRILTIHESKGLEAPVIFLVDSTTTKKNTGGESVFIDWPSEAKHPQSIFLSPSTQYPAPFCQQAIEQQQVKDRQEDINLLYVAVTRAKQFLYISGNKKPDGWFKLICDRFEIILDEHQQATVIEHHEGNSTTPATLNKTKTESMNIDVRLQQPVKFEIPFVEISPSRLETKDTKTEFYPKNSMTSNSTQAEAIQRGNMIHDMLFNLSIFPQLSINEYVKNNQLELPDNGVEENWLQAQQTISHFPEYFSEDRYQHAYGEVPIYYKQDNRLIHGIIDRLVVTDTDAIIIDYKTHAFDSDENQIQNQLTMLADQYRSQLILYQQGVKSLYPKLNTRALIIFTSVPTSLEIS